MGLVDTQGTEAQDPSVSQADRKVLPPTATGPPDGPNFGSLLSQNEYKRVSPVNANLNREYRRASYGLIA